MPRRIDPAELAVFNALFASVAEEMGVTLGRTAHSSNIKERHDYSCAVFDGQGRLVAQAAHIPVHLGAMPSAVAAAMPLAPFAPGDLVILNDPYLGGTHLPDITMVSPVFSGRALAGFVASRAHHADVGGVSPGSMALAEELIQEGVVIPPIKLYERGRLNRAVFDLLLSNVRSPEERKGDLDAQTAAQRVGEARFREIVERYGLPHVRRQMQAVMDYAERMTRSAISQIANGVYEFEDFLDDDGLSDEPVPIRLRLTVDRDAMHCDFSGSSPERPSSVNAVAAVTRSAVYYVVRCLLDAVPGRESVPSNDGCFRPVTFVLPERSVVNAGPPRAVAAGNVETSQRIVDVVLGALAPALPDRIPAASVGTMNNVSIGSSLAARPEPVLSAVEGPVEGRAALSAAGRRRGGPSFPLPPSSNLRTFAYYETVGGGAGAGPDADGLSAVHTHMTNTMNTPVEALEMAYPIRLVEYSVRRGSGGPGRHRGGDGIRRTWEFLAPATVSLLTERRRRPPWGLAGGGPGQPGRNLLFPRTLPARRGGSLSKGRPEPPPEAGPPLADVEGPERDNVAATFRSPGGRRAAPEPIELPSKGQVKVQPGDRLTLETPGGGGYGSVRSS